MPCNCNNRHNFTLKKNMENILVLVVEKNDIQKNSNLHFYRKITLETLNGEVIISADSILGIEVFGKYCCIHTCENDYNLKRMSMCQLLDFINLPTLIRCHKSYAVNLSHIVTIQKSRRNIWHAVFNCKTDFNCEISKTYYDKVTSNFKILQVMAK